MPVGNMRVKHEYSCAGMEAVAAAGHNPRMKQLRAIRRAELSDKFTHPKPHGSKASMVTDHHGANALDFRLKYS